MVLDSAWRSLERARRMFAALCVRAGEIDQQAFEDRLPYVLDLMAGVRRQIDEQIPKGGAAAAWWRGQMTVARDAITQMRHAQLKRLESTAQRQTYSHSMSSAGTFNGKPVNAGDSIVWWQWYFVGGHFDGQDVLAVLSAQLDDLASLIRDAEARLP
jgi:hypothetical protein